MFCLSGKGSTISCDIFPALDLSDGDWELGMIDFTTYNSIPNVEEGVNNLFHFGSQIVEIPTGSYEIDDIIEIIAKQIDDPDKLSIKGNNNTFKVEIYTAEAIDFTHKASVGKSLGFPPRVLAAGKWHESEKPIVINQINVLRIEVNIVRGSYQNGNEGHIIHEFYPSEPPGYKIVETPQNVIYLPVNVRKLENITVNLVDQNHRPINLRGETVNLRLHLRRRHGSKIQ